MDLVEMMISIPKLTTAVLNLMSIPFLNGIGEEE
jgi:hypothetical protein